MEEYRCTYCETKVHLYASFPMFTSFISSFMVYSLISTFVTLRHFVMASKDSTWIKVHFKKTKSESGGTATVPRSWVNRSEMWSFWPTQLSKNKLIKIIKDCEKPPPRGSPKRANWLKLEITMYGRIGQTYEAAEECATDLGTLTDQPASEEEATHSSGSDGDVEDTAQSRKRKEKQMSDFTSGAELDLSEKEQSTNSQIASQPVSDIPQDVGDISLSQSFLSV